MLAGIEEISAVERLNQNITGLTLDSRKVNPGNLFVALSGAVKHGLEYAQQAAEQGAEFVIYEKQGSESFSLNRLSVPSLGVDNLSQKVGYIADRFFSSPSKKLDVIGITGTNGKTTCSHFLAQSLPLSNLIGTLGWGAIDALQKTENTTPDAITLQEILAELVAENKKAVAMEVSSHGLQQGRVNGIHFTGAVFTNLSHDHLDYHGSMEQYLNAKLKLFCQPGLSYVVVNADDEFSDKFLKVAPKSAKKWSFSINQKKIDQTENVWAEKIDSDLSGTRFFLKWGENKILMETTIVGDFNLENILAVITVLLAQGVSLAKVAKVVSELQPVCGRLEQFGGRGKPHVFVDYAHTPDALKKILQTLKEQCHQKLWLVFGCGGNRDQSKRRQMGEIASQFADHIVITDDNPRFESPDQIVKEIVDGILNKDCDVIQNREYAIQKVISSAQKEDCVVIAGKGHEDYQEVNGIKRPFRDQDIVIKALKNWGYH